MVSQERNGSATLGQINDPIGIGTTIDEISEQDNPIVGRGRQLLQELVKLMSAAVDVSYGNNPGWHLWWELKLAIYPKQISIRIQSIDMDLNLQPLSQKCCITGSDFTDGARVASFLVQDPKSPEVLRFDMLESAIQQFTTPGPVICRWVHPYKARRAGENADKALKLTTENLFLTLADPTTEPSEENTRLLQFLALMLERKRILKPRGASVDGLRQRFEHARSKQMFEIPAAELDSDFFIRVQEQLSVLVGVPKNAAKSKTVPPSESAPTPASPTPTQESPAETA